MTTKTNLTCQRCQTNLLERKKQFCTYCGWDYWYSPDLRESDLASALTIRQQLLSSLETALGKIDDLQKQSEALGVEKKAVTAQLQNTQQQINALSEQQNGLKRELEAKKERVKALTLQEECLTNSNNSLIKKLKQHDALIFNTINYQESKNRIIEVEYEKDRIIFQINFSGPPELLLVLQTARKQLGLSSTNDILIAIKSYLKPKQAYRHYWILQVNAIPMPVNGTFFINFTTAFREGANEKIIGDIPRQYTF